MNEENATREVLQNGEKKRKMKKKKKLIFLYIYAHEHSEKFSLLMRLGMEENKKSSNKEIS